MSRIAALCAVAIAVASTATAQEPARKARIERALSAAPASVTANATVMEWEGRAVLRPGSNGYTCFPDAPVSSEPFCVDETFIRFMEALVRREEPGPVARVSIGYWLQGGGEGLSNEDPFATPEERAKHVVFDGAPHLGVLVPDRSLLDGLPSDPAHGGPWVMWGHTPYAHLMIPASRQR